MELRDFVVTPLVIIGIYILAYYVRPFVTDTLNRRYFFPALSLKIFGALALGFIYQFYYSGGDTFGYHTHGSRILWEALLESPEDGIRAFYAHGTYGEGLWEIADRIWYWRDPGSFFIIQLATIFDFFTFSTYSATAALFSVIAFAGSWMLFLVFYRTRPAAHKLLAICCLFIPSVIFWGSGLLKDTISLAFMGSVTYCVYRIFIEKKFKLTLIILLSLSLFVIFSVKKYILIAFLTGLMMWIFSNLFFKIRSLALRIILVPIVVITCLTLTYFTITQVMKDDSKYSIDRIAQTSRITAYDIRYGWGARTGDGSSYTLGELDGTWQSMFRLAPGAINASLFRPYLWEVRNPLMLLSAIESTITLFFTLYLIFRVNTRLFKYIKSEVIFCLVFTLIFAFGVGVSTFNFGTLVRYKIPFLPFYWSALVIIYSAWKEDRILKAKQLVEL